MPIGSEGFVARQQASVPRLQDNLFRPPRQSGYSENLVQNIVNGSNAVADEGAYFVATNATPGTSIAFGGAAVVSFTDTTGVGLVLQNTDVVGGPNSKRIYLDYIRLVTTTGALPNTAVAQQFWGGIDNVLTRYTSGGTSLTPVNPNMDASNKSVAKVVVGAITAVALSAGGRLTQRFAGRTGINIIGDEVLIKFGGVEGGASNQATVVANRQVVNAPPHIIAPGCTYALGQYNANQTAAPIMEYEIGWYER